MVFDEDEIEEYVSEFEDILRYLNEESKTKLELYEKLADMFTKSYNKLKQIDKEERDE